jgi:hypothetical protein
VEEFSKELRERLQKAKAAALLVAALNLNEERPSAIVNRRDAIVTMEELPADATPACRAVVARRNSAGEFRVLTVGHGLRAFRGMRDRARPATKIAGYKRGYGSKNPV